MDARDLAVPEGEGQSRAATNVHQRIAGLLADAQRVRDILPGGADRQSLRGLDRIVGRGDCIDRVTLGSGNRIDREAGVPVYLVGAGNAAAGAGFTEAQRLTERRQRASLAGVPGVSVAEP